MKIVEFAEFGVPHEVARCADAPDPGPPADDEVVVEVEAFPINPVDLLTIEGRYAARPPLPATPGSEGVGRLAETGAGVASVTPGDRVLLMGRANWVQRRTCKEREVLRLPPGGDALQLAMLKINPATALCMLRNYIDLAPGDWIIQNAANSAVGTNLVRLARAEGVRTVNVVRRAEPIERLEAAGGDVVLVDGDDLPERVAAATDGAGIRLATDAVAGEACGRLARCLAEGGTVVNYGLLSGRPCTVDPHHLVFRRITLTGFWLVTALGAMSADERAALYADLGRRVVAGDLHVDVEATYAIEDIRAALEHAARGERGGKVLVTPNGPVG
ncbi:MAG: zinc-dependent alcohol dehydrogenase family protein [Alphaproteobacteria bacterium]